MFVHAALEEEGIEQACLCQHPHSVLCILNRGVPCQYHIGLLLANHCYHGIYPLAHHLFAIAIAILHPGQA